MLKHLKLAPRLFGIVGVALVVAVAIVVTLIQIQRVKAYNLRETHLNDVVDAGVSVAQYYHDRAAQGEMSMDEAQERAARALGAMRFDGSNYYFAFDLDTNVIVHGGNSKRNGNNMSAFTDPDGVKVYVELAKIAKTTGSGLLEYKAARFNSDVNAKVPQPKLSFVRVFKPWGWAIAAGAYIEDVEAALGEVRDVSIAAAAIGMLLLLGASLLIARSITRPLGELRARMMSLRDGDLEAPIPSLEARNEIGDMAQAVAAFQEDAKRVLELNAQNAATEERARVEKAEMLARLAAEIGGVAAAAADGDFTGRVAAKFSEDSLQAMADNLNQVMAAVETSLDQTTEVMGQVAKGDLNSRMTGDFKGAFQTLQQNVNDTIDRLSDLLSQISTTSTSVRGGADGITDASSRLAERAEQQASTLEETAATMEEIAASIKANASSSSSASALANAASQRATSGGDIVTEAISAMKEIEEGAGKIEQIISVIEGIAFQTNLLALNAAVEAARAGDAGKGFAVVAAEVRELAQRSSNAARDINGLIQNSSEQVSKGVDMVSRTGESLTGIVTAIVDVEQSIEKIAKASSEQAAGVEEVSTAVSHLDQLTQQNASMAAESASNAQRLSSDARSLQELLSYFNVGAATRPAAIEEDLPAPPAQAPQPAMLKAVGENGSWAGF